MICILVSWTKDVINDDSWVTTLDLENDNVLDKKIIDFVSNNNNWHMNVADFDKLRSLVVDKVVSDHKWCMTNNLWIYNGDLTQDEFKINWGPWNEMHNVKLVKSADNRIIDDEINNVWKHELAMQSGMAFGTDGYNQYFDCNDEYNYDDY